MDHVAEEAQFLSEADAAAQAQISNILGPGFTASAVSKQCHEVSYSSLTLKVLVTTLMPWDTIKQDNYSTMGGDGRCRVGEVQAGTTSTMSDHKCYISGNFVRNVVGGSLTVAVALKPL